MTFYPNDGRVDDNTIRFYCPSWQDAMLLIRPVGKGGYGIADDVHRPRVHYDG